MQQEQMAQQQMDGQKADYEDQFSQQQQMEMYQQQAQMMP